MSISIVIDAGERKPFDADLDHLPKEVEIRRSSSTGLFVMLFFFCLFTLLAVANMVPSLFWPALLVWLLAGAGLAYLWNRSRGRHHLVRFLENGVEVREIGLFGEKNWQADYEEFEGVEWRERTARTSASSVTYQIIELKHRKRRKTLPLFVRLGEDRPLVRWRRFADLFRLPRLAGEDLGLQEE